MPDVLKILYDLRDSDPEQNDSVFQIIIQERIDAIYLEKYNKHKKEMEDYINQRVNALLGEAKPTLRNVNEDTPPIKVVKRGKKNVES